MQKQELAERSASAEMVVVPRAAIEGAISMLEKDGDEQGVALNLFAMLSTAVPAGQATGSISVNGRSATHYCSYCGALWLDGGDHWSLVSLNCGPCCDNVPMGQQITRIAAPQQGGQEVGSSEAMQSFLDPVVRRAIKVAVESAAHYGWSHASWDWESVKGGLDRFGVNDGRKEVQQPAEAVAERVSPEHWIAIGRAQALAEFTEQRATARREQLSTPPQQPAEAVYLIKDDFGLWREQTKAEHDWWDGKQNAPARRVLYTTPPPAIDIGKLRELVSAAKQALKLLDRPEVAKALHGLGFLNTREVLREAVAAALIGDGGEKGNG